MESVERVLSSMYMTYDEVEIAARLYNFLKRLSGNTNMLNINHEELVKISAAILGMEPFEAHKLITKMRKMGFLKEDGNLVILRRSPV